LRTLDFLARLHETLAPPTYLEIGVRYGDSLVYSRAPSIAIDPVFKLKHPVPERAVLFEETSDAYFGRERPLEPFGGRPASLALIDGMHLSEYSLRDFINVERHADWTSVVVFDDILPRTVEEASRERATRSWTGDVFKIMDLLSENRPDLIQLRVATRPTGLLLVLGLDPESEVLGERINELVDQAAAPDPQSVPFARIEREGVLDPESVLTAAFWGELRHARDRGVRRADGLDALREAAAADVARAKRVRYPPRSMRNSLRRLRRTARLG